MQKIIRSRKGVNDISIMFGIISIFILLGIILPYMNAEYNTSNPEYNTGDLDFGVDDDTTLTSISALILIKSVAGMFFWTFGALPFWLDGIFLIIRIILGILIYRQVKSGGG